MGVLSQDVMLLNQSLLFDGAGGMHDRYRDMRLDVDNMSYEVKKKPHKSLSFLLVKASLIWLMNFRNCWH